MPAPRTSLSSAKLQTKMSAWTPLNHQLGNSMVFFERQILLAKWFDKWSDSQRKLVLQDFLSKCSVGQLRFLRSSLERELPLEAVDFTCLLPRVLSLYIFSFLDPRSLCRCAQVSWHWRSVVELDQLWMPKCLRLGWSVTFSPMPHEHGIWKRLYIETVKTLCIGKPQTPSPQQPFVVPEVTVVRDATQSAPEQARFEEARSTPAPRRARSGARRRSLDTVTGKQPICLPPWRDADRHPKDIVRFNYLANLDPVEQALQGQRKGVVNHTGRKALSETSYKLRKAKSQMLSTLDLDSNFRPHQPPSSFTPTPPPPPPPPDLHPHLHQHQSRPDWARAGSNGPVTVETAKGLVRWAQWNAGIPPAPARSAVPRLSAGALRVSQRSHRSLPSMPLFESQPWMSNLTSS